MSLFGIRVKLQIEEVVSSMRDNMHKIFERGNKMEELERHSESLIGVSSDFKTAATRYFPLLSLSTEFLNKSCTSQDEEEGLLEKCHILHCMYFIHHAHHHHLHPE